ncbi:unnamed protein product [Lasius platythorax]|uniref:Endonuclease/exonuclease/phosphatase domain-containing protein n=1 Tax=Lasius platythorax TaxID=488582 RepID=A0AAV2NBT8_9HYME
MESIYAPPSLSPDEFTDFLDKLTKDAKEHFPVAIAGDFNAWAVDWESKETNTKGQALLEAMSSLDVVLLNSGDEPTFAKGKASSIVDLTFVSSILAKGNCSWEMTNVYTASDHRAIVWDITTGRGDEAGAQAQEEEDKLAWLEGEHLRPQLISGSTG